MVPTNTPAFSSSGLAKLTSPFLSPTTETSPPSLISNGQDTVTACCLTCAGIAGTHYCLAGGEEEEEEQKDEGIPEHIMVTHSLFPDPKNKLS